MPSVPTRFWASWAAGHLSQPNAVDVVVEVLEQAVLDERDHRRQPDQVRRVVARQQPRRRGHEVRELVLADVPGDVRELLGELLRELERQVEAGLEVGVQLDRVGPAGRTGGGRARRRGCGARRAARRRRGRGGRRSRGRRLASTTAPGAAHAATRMQATAMRRHARRPATSRSARPVWMLTMNAPPRSLSLAVAEPSHGSSSTALLRRRRGRADHQLGRQMERPVAPRIASRSRPAASRRPVGRTRSSCWRTVVSPT